MHVTINLISGYNMYSNFVVLRQSALVFPFLNNLLVDERNKNLFIKNNLKTSEDVTVLINKKKNEREAGGPRLPSTTAFCF